MPGTQRSVVTSPNRIALVRRSQILSWRCWIATMLGRQWQRTWGSVSSSLLCRQVGEQLDHGGGAWAVQPILKAKIQAGVLPGRTIRVLVVEQGASDFSLIWECC